MKNKVTLKRIFHRDSLRIGIFFRYNEWLKSLVKTIPEVQFSVTKKCFYTDDSEECLRIILKTLRGSADIDIEQLTGKSEVIENKTDTDADLWVNPGPDHLSEEEFTPVTIKRSRAVELRINEDTGSLVIRLPVPYKSEWIREIKSFHGRFDPVRKEWSLRWSKLACDSLADYFSRSGVEVEVRKQVIDEDLRLERKRIGDEIRGRNLSGKASEGLYKLQMYLVENRFSARTKEAYMSMMEFFLKYFNERDPYKISGEEISKFINGFIIKLGYSASYQNQLISAIKTYYSVTGNHNISVDVPGRPRKARSLPKTFSKEEIGRILNSSGNIKHKLLLWMIYSCGLRRSEVTNIKLRDIDRDRSIIHIREGKGMVDRIVPVSEKVWQKMEEYLAYYSPREYLFEGQTGGRYSSESVYRVFKMALSRAGIRKEVGVHSLRHSYATHLHESGLDIKYIQELLGHKSTRTTEIYTHISRRNLISVRSPIEDLDVK
jgi:integrase/recombinase XerD